MQAPRSKPSAKPSGFKAGFFGVKKDKKATKEPPLGAKMARKSATGPPPASADGFTFSAGERAANHNKKAAAAADVATGPFAFHAWVAASGEYADSSNMALSPSDAKRALLAKLDSSLFATQGRDKLTPTAFAGARRSLLRRHGRHLSRSSRAATATRARACSDI
jgi:hypothetical protein